MITREEHTLAALSTLRKNPAINTYGDMLLTALEAKIKDTKGRWRVYHHEIYDNQTAMSIPLKKAGDSLEQHSEGLITRRFDTMSRFHYVEVEK